MHQSAMIPATGGQFSVQLNHTHDPHAHSWVSSANDAATDFPLQNLPHGVFRIGQQAARGGIAIGDQILDLQAALALNLFSGAVVEIARAAAQDTLNGLLALGNEAAALLRARVFELLHADSQQLSRHAAQLLVPQAAVRMQLPVISRNFTDFCPSIPHVTANRRARPGRPLHQALKHLPVGYGGRSSSVVVSGTTVTRPYGQYMNHSEQVVFEPTRLLDFELEFGAYVTGSNALGERIAIGAADQHLFGYVLLNDWSARDIQRFESLLGPFLGKSFATTVSPWIVTQQALLPFRQAPLPRATDDPQPLPYLTDASHAAHGALNVSLQALLRTARMRAEGLPAHIISDTSLLHLFWTLPQMLTHHASNGCVMESGDLLGSGTVSGPEEHQAACLWEITGGSLPIELPTGETRVWLEDGDELLLRGRAQRAGYRSVGFGDCTGCIAPAQ